jgi:CRISPR-associated protein Cas1
VAGGRFIEVARHAARISLRHGCLTVQREDAPDTVVPVFEVSAVVLAHPQAAITQPAMAALMAEGVPLVICDGSMLPAGMMLPLRGHTLQTQRMRAQVAASLPLRKRLWAGVVRAKLLAQATALEGLHGDDGGLRALAARVRSGDPDNAEAQGAARYWPLLFRDPLFRRRFDADDQNRLLNYGYAVIRAGVARAICASGLHPTIGLHHHGRENPYSLADDLMEPYRPLVDAEVAAMTGERGRDCPLDADAKARLIALLELRLHARRGAPDTVSVAEAMFSSAVSLAGIYEGRGRDPIEYPWGLTHW